MAIKIQRTWRMTRAQKSIACTGRRAAALPVLGAARLCDPASGQGHAREDALPPHSVEVLGRAGEDHVALEGMGRKEKFKLRVTLEKVELPDDSEFTDRMLRGSGYGRCSSVSWRRSVSATILLACGGSCSSQCGFMQRITIGRCFQEDTCHPIPRLRGSKWHGSRGFPRKAGRA